MIGKASITVIQRNLVYVTNIDPSLSLAQLQSPDFFGQFGKPKKITLRQNVAAKAQSAYVIYNTDEEALDCLYTVAESWFNNY